MLTEPQIESLKPKFSVCQIIVWAMILGTFFFLGMMLSMSRFDQLNAPLKMLTIIGAVGAAGSYTISILVPTMFGKTPDSSTSEDDLAGSIVGIIQSELIIRYALIEGMVFLNGMVFFLESHGLSLLMAGLGCLLMILFFPSRGKLVRMVEQRLDDHRHQL